jgi:hypothetical protein
MEKDHAAITADTLELLLMNQQALRAGIEELTLWIRQRGSEPTADNVMIAMQALDTHAEALAAGIEALRS